MSSLSMVEAKLPPGFRFHPRDDELVCDYLFKKWNGCESSLLTEVDLNKCEPWDIPACVGGKEWYFYSQRDRKYATGLRTNRATVSGYWKATGKDRPVVRRGSLVGMRKTLVFYQGRAPKGKKGDWVMHEFRIEGPFGPPKLTSSSKEDWVLCRVFFKNKDAPTRSDTENDGNSSFDESGSSSLPPLMDSLINFDQTHPSSNTNNNDNNNNNNNNNNNVSYQQVPCFSIFTANQNNVPNNNNNQINTIYTHQNNNNNNFQLDQNICTKNHNPTSLNNSIVGLPNNNGLATNNLSSIACDKKVLEAVLSHLTKMENSSAINGSSPASLGEAASSESYLSEVGLQQPSMWNHY